MARTLYDTAQNASTPAAGHYADIETRVEQLASLVNEHAGALDAIGAPISGAADSTASETITSGAATLGVLLTLLSTTGVKAYTLADGTVDGQIHAFEEITAATAPAGTLTVAHMDTPGGGANATFVFNTKGQRLVLQWRAALSAWHILDLVAVGQAAVIVGTTVLTGMVMNQTLNLTVAATVHSIGTKGIPNGRRPGQRLHVGVSAASATPIGDIAITAWTKTALAAATSLANLTDTTMSLTVEWDGAAWQTIEFTPGTGVATLS